MTTTFLCEGTALTHPPILYRCDQDAGAMLPLPQFRKRFASAYEHGKIYRQVDVEERSTKSHSAYFAFVTDCWQSLPDELAIQFPTADALRKHALIMTGFRRERKFVASSAREARKLAVFLTPGPHDDYAIVSVKDNVVVELKPLSQSYKGMPTKGQFHASQKAVREWLSDLLGLNDDMESAARSPHTRDAADGGGVSPEPCPAATR